MNEFEIVIIGGGLTGMTLQYLLQKENVNSIIIEARDRVGGRIQTVEKEGYAPIELGATWFGPQHTYLDSLLEELGVSSFPQELGEHAIYEPISTSPPQLVTLPNNENPSYRIQGGTNALIKTLSKNIDPKTIYLEQEVSSIQKDGSNLRVNTQTDSFCAQRIVSTLPPALWNRNIKVEPQLSPELGSLMESTHTWMGESIKIALYFNKPFWRSDNLSGTVFSNVGPISELYDHSNYEDNLYAIMGFLNGSYHSLTKDERMKVVMTQLRKYYGTAIEDYVGYKELVWRNEKFTYVDYQHHVLPHQNNGHSLYQKSYLDGRLYIGGSETSSHFPGYMEGAVCSARRLYSQLQELM